MRRNHSTSHLIEESSVYDVYIWRKCQKPPDLSDLADQIPLVTSPIFQQWLVTQQETDLGFLQLNLKQALAQELLGRLQAVGATGDVVKAKYRHAGLTFSQAYQIAIPALQKLQNRRMPDYTFERPTFYREEVETWTFIAMSPQLIDQGYVPGGLLVSIDKIDGHVWRPKEFKAGVT
jgi:hypothetical protein